MCPVLFSFHSVFCRAPNVRFCACPATLPCLCSPIQCPNPRLPRCPQLAVVRLLFACSSPAIPFASTLRSGKCLCHSYSCPRRLLCSALALLLGWVLQRAFGKSFAAFGLCFVHRCVVVAPECECLPAVPLLHGKFFLFAPAPVDWFLCSLPCASIMDSLSLLASALGSRSVPSTCYL